MHAPTSSPEHRRSRRRPSAARERRRHDLDRLQRRDLQPRRRPAGARGGRPRYRTRSDTETIVHAYEQWGDACVERLRGMFAFAIWDAPRRRLLLARDRLGVKPLYWAQAGDRLLFGSEIKAILASGLIRAEANERGCRSCSAPATCRAPRRCSRASTGCCPGTRSVFEDGTVTHRAHLGHPGRAGAMTARAAHTDEDAVAAVPRAARGVGPHPADGRRAARHVPVRRPRQQRDRRADGAA